MQALELGTYMISSRCRLLSWVSEVSVLDAGIGAGYLRYQFYMQALELGIGAIIYHTSVESNITYMNNNYNPLVHHWLAKSPNFHITSWLCHQLAMSPVGLYHQLAVSPIGLYHQLACITSWLVSPVGLFHQLTCITYLPFISGQRWRIRLCCWAVIQTVRHWCPCLTDSPLHPGHRIHVVPTVSPPVIS